MNKTEFGWTDTNKSREKNLVSIWNWIIDSFILLLDPKSELFIVIFMNKTKREFYMLFSRQSKIELLEIALKIAGSTDTENERDSLVKSLKTIR